MKKKRKISEKSNLEEIKEQMKVEVEAKMEAKVEVMRAQMEEMQTIMHQFLFKSGDIPVTSSELKNNNVDSTPALDGLDAIKMPTACELVIPYGTMNQRCARGMVFPFGNGKIHSVPLNENHLKVSIDYIYEQYHCIPLPVLTEEVSNLGEALNGIVQWPRKAIILTQASKSRPVVEPPKQFSTLPLPVNSVQQMKQNLAPTSLSSVSMDVTKNTEAGKKIMIPMTTNKPTHIKKQPRVIQSMYKRLMNRENPDDGIYVEAESGILGAKKIETYINPEEIIRLLKNEWLDISVITWYQIMLHSMAGTSRGNKVNKCAFISPSEIQATICESNSRGVVSYLIDTMRFHQEKEFFVAPYWQSSHWMLLVICPHQRTGYILDSLKDSDKKPVESYMVVKYIEEAVMRYKENTATRTPMTWTLAECNQQPSNWECGYYVMRWMFEFVLNRQNEFPKRNMWNDKKPFPDSVLKEIVAMWSSRFASKYLSDVPL